MKVKAKKTKKKVVRPAVTVQEIARVKTHAEHQIRLMGDHLYGPENINMNQLQEMRNVLNKTLDKLFEMAERGII